MARAVLLFLFEIESSAAGEDDSISNKNKRRFGMRKQYDLEERTERFAKEVRSFLRRVTRTVLVEDDIRQLLRSSGSVGANYVEASQAVSRKDFLLRIKICRKEAKETRYWLRVLDQCDTLDTTRAQLIQEAHELTCIFGPILRNAGP